MSALTLTTLTHIFREYLRENEKVSETVCACSYGAQVESLKKEKNSQKPRDTVPFNKILLTVLYNYIYYYKNLKNID